MVCGWLDLANWQVRDLLSAFPLLLGPCNLWLAPIVSTGFFLGIGIFWAASFLITGYQAVLLAARFSFLLLTIVNLLLMYPQIHHLSVGLLSIGITAVGIRHLGKHQRWAEAAIRRTIPALGAATAVWGVGFPIGWQWQEARRFADLPPAAAGSPNIVLIVWDSVRAASLSTYGFQEDTSPHLSRLAEEGILFEMAVAPSSWTLPSHASFFTGIFPEELPTVWGKRLERRYRTLAEVLTQHGYATAGFVANQLFCSRIHGLDQGFIHYEDFTDPRVEWLLSLQVGRRLVCSPRLKDVLGLQTFWGRKPAGKVTEDFLRWLDRRPQRPFFAFLNFFDAHQPYWAPPPYDERFGPVSLRQSIRYDLKLRYATVVDPESLGPEQRRGEEYAYQGAIAYLDACLGRILDGLRARGLLENTVIIVTSDHGEHFGEHGLRDHGNSLYRALLHVPLVIRLPGGSFRGIRIRRPVSLCDLPATLLDLAGAAGQLPGKSWVGLWTGRAEQKEGNAALAGEPIFAALRPLISPLKGNFHMDAVVWDRYWYIRDHAGNEELFDWLRDRDERVNLVALSGFAPILERCRRLSAEKPPRAGPMPELQMPPEQGSGPKLGRGRSPAKPSG
jgi:arylsulfatase A-like enzyme